MESMSLCGTIGLIWSMNIRKITFAQKLILAACGSHLNYFKHLVTANELVLRTGHYSTESENLDFYGSEVPKISFNRLYPQFFDCAAVNGELQVLRSGLDQSVLGSEFAMIGAIKQGHTGVVKWLNKSKRIRSRDGNRMTGCIPGSIFAAAVNQQDKILNYLVDDCRNRKDEIKDALVEAKKLKLDRIVHLLKSKMVMSTSSRKTGKH
jgi:hypothetical protein